MHLILELNCSGRWSAGDVTTIRENKYSVSLEISEVWKVLFSATFSLELFSFVERH